MAGLREKGCAISLEDVSWVVDLITEEVIYRYVDRLISQAETVLEIDPTLTEKRSLRPLRKPWWNISEQRRQACGSMTRREEMVSFGSYPDYAEVVRRRFPLKIPSPARS